MLHMYTVCIPYKTRETEQIQSPRKQIGSRLCSRDMASSGWGFRVRFGFQTQPSSKEFVNSASGNAVILIVK